MSLISDFTNNVIKGIRDSTYEFATEDRLSGAGLKGEQDLHGVLEKYAWLYERGVVRRMQEAYRSEADLHLKERLRRVYYYLLDGYLERRTAAMEDAIASFEMDATSEVGEDLISYHDIPALITVEPDFEKRNRLRETFLRIVEKTNPERSIILQIRLEILQVEFGYTSYAAYVSEKKCLDHHRLLSRLEKLLQQTEDMYEAHMCRWVEETTNRKFGEIGDHHFSYMAGIHRYDTYFESNRLIEVYKRTLADMGLNRWAQENIHLDAEERPAKDPRPCCYVPDPPGEVHLVIKPVGGFEDYVNFFHEAGHAQHYANEDSTLDYVDRAMPTSYALTEVYAFLMQNLTQNKAWLRNIAGLPEEAARRVIYHAKLTDLYFLRRYVAKLKYELDFYKEPENEERNRRLYAICLSSVTGFLSPPENYLRDIDSDFYSADYLRAWITEAMLRRHLEGTFGEEWFARSEAGAFLLELWSKGESLENEDVSRMLGYEPFDTTCLAEQYVALESLDSSM